MLNTPIRSLRYLSAPSLPGILPCCRCYSPSLCSDRTLLSPTSVGAHRFVGGREEPTVPGEGGTAWETTKCVSCHHGPWMMWSGFEVQNAASPSTIRRSKQCVLPRSRLTSSTRPCGRPAETCSTTWPSMSSISPSAWNCGRTRCRDGEVLRQGRSPPDRAAEGRRLVEGIHQDDRRQAGPVIHDHAERRDQDFLMAPLIDSDDVTTLWASWRCTIANRPACPRMPSPGARRRA